MPGQLCQVQFRRCGITAFECSVSDAGFDLIAYILILRGCSFLFQCNALCSPGTHSIAWSPFTPVYTDVYDSTYLAYFCSQGKVVKKQYYGIGVLVGAMWLVFFANLILPIDLAKFGLYPRSFSGILGIPLMPFLHANLDHLVGNTIPLIVLLFLLVSSREDAWLAVGCIVVLSGGVLWLFGRSAVHVGASGLMFGLCSFLIIVGIRERRMIPIAITILVGLIYGGTMLSGIVPRWQSNVSWDGHLCGLLAGGLAGFLFSRPQRA